MKKRLLSLVLAFCLVFGLVGAVAPVAMAEEVPTEGTYGESVTWRFDVETGVLTVGGEGNMPGSLATGYVRPDWKDFADQIVEVIILEGVVSVSYSSFSGLNALERVAFPESVTHIGEYAFNGCEKLSEVSLSTGLTSIGERAFSDCTALAEITLPDSMVSLGRSVFDYTAITSIYIPASLTSINKEAFRNCTTLKRFQVDPANNTFYSDPQGVLMKKSGNVPYRVPRAYEGEFEIPQGVTQIGKEEFYGCHKLTNVVIPNSVHTIAGGAFWYCDSLTHVEIPSSVTNLSPVAFSRCRSLQAYIVDKTHPCYASVNGALLSKDKTELLAVPNGREIEFEIPESVTTIKPYAFRGCDLLTVLEIPEGVTTIEDFAFIECASLTRIIFPASLMKLGTNLSSGGETGYTNPPKAIEFRGDMPVMTVFAFDNTEVDVYYPADNATWEGIHDLDVPDYYKITWIPYTPHNYGPWKVLEEPTATEYGLKKRICTDCGAEETRAIARLTDWNDSDPEPLPNPFTDVKESDYFYEPVLWAYADGITTGTTATTFTPNGTCTRAQVVTFLWRAMGCPEPGFNRRPFTDVDSSEYYYKAVLWAVEKGITTGTSATTFDPNGSCTRAQVVTFLWRAAGSPEPTSPRHSFTDISPAEYYYDAVLWAVENQITNGMTQTTFEPGRTCTRGQVVTFLWRYLTA